MQYLIAYLSVKSKKWRLQMIRSSFPLFLRRSYIHFMCLSDIQVLGYDNLQEFYTVKAMNLTCKIKNKTLFRNSALSRGSEMSLFLNSAQMISGYRSLKHFLSDLGLARAK